MGEPLHYSFWWNTAGHVPVCYEIINLFIKPQHFLLMFFICKIKGLYLIVMVCDGLLMLPLDLFNFCIKSTWYDIFQDALFMWLTLVFFRVYNDIKRAGQWHEKYHDLQLLPWMSHYDTPFQPSGRSEFSDLWLPALPLTCGSELTLKISPLVAS